MSSHGSPRPSDRPTANDVALDVGEGDFQTLVLDRSHALPVVVDFWAPWCGPCRQFGPVLERAAEARAGALVLVKVDTAANPSLAEYFGVHGIPAVKAFRRREVVAQFVGARSPAHVARFMDALAPAEIDLLVADGSEPALRRAVELDPRRTDAAVGLARLLHRRGHAAEALDVLRPVSGAFRADGLAARIRLDGVAEVTAGFAALDAGELRSGLQQLLAAPVGSPERRADVRRIILSVLDRLGFGHPLAGEMRDRLDADAFLT